MKEEKDYFEIMRKIQKKPDPREFDADVSSGEQVSAALLAMALKKKGYNSRSYNAFQMGFKTDSSFGRARIRKVSEEILQDALEKNIVPVITGFQGFDDENNITWTQVSEKQTFDFVLNNFFTIWIKATPKEHMERVIKQGDLRPMASNPKAMDDLNNILKERKNLYSQADVILNTKDKNPGTSYKDLKYLIKN